MTRVVFVGRQYALAVALLAVVGILLTLPATAAHAEPGPTGNGQVEPEGGTPALRKALEEASRGYNDAKARLDASQRRQAQMVQQMQALQKRVDELSVEVGALAAAAYRGSRMSMFAALLEAGSPNNMLQAATTVEHLARKDAAQIHELTAARNDLAEQRAKLDAEIRVQREQLKEMDRRKKDAEKALRAVGGEVTTGPGGTASARPAPRNPDGTWPRQSCSQNDPTTDGCLTPRTLHAYNQARAAGFTRYCSCYRSGGSGEHPKGRACDFAAQKDGFGGAATGGDKTYGDRLAGFFVANAERLGVLYVIWYRRIWMPGNGWRSYSGGGSPAAAHTNHVHLSVH